MGSSIEGEGASLYAGDLIIGGCENNLQAAQSSCVAEICISRTTLPVSLVIYFGVALSPPPVNWGYGEVIRSRFLTVS